MIIHSSNKIRKDYNSISKEAKETKQPIYLTKNGEGDLVVLDIETFNQREQMLILREELLKVEENKLYSKGISKEDAYEQWNLLLFWNKIQPLSITAWSRKSKN